MGPPWTCDREPRKDLTERTVHSLGFVPQRVFAMISSMIAVLASA